MAGYQIRIEVSSSLSDWCCTAGGGRITELHCAAGKTLAVKGSAVVLVYIYTTRVLPDV